MTDTRHILTAMGASFLSGVRQRLANPLDLLSGAFIYAVLLLVFAPIYRVMPMEKLGMEGLTPGRLLWSFALAESVVCGQSFLRFGNVIAEGRLALTMQRPVGLRALVLPEAIGHHAVGTAGALAVGAVLVPILTGETLGIGLAQVPLLILALAFALVLFNLMGYIAGMVEIFGPYSRPLGWIMTKFVFTLGGLFFPVALFPPLARTIAWATPFPAVLAAPGEFALGVYDWRSFAAQAGWIGALFVAAVLAERAMIRRILDKGD